MNQLPAWLIQATMKYFLAPILRYRQRHPNAVTSRLTLIAAWCSPIWVYLAVRLIFELAQVPAIIAALFICVAIYAAVIL